MDARSAWMPLFAGALMTLALAGHGTWAAGKAAVPKLVVEQPEVGLEDREPGTRLEFVFHLKNAGSAPLLITRVKPSCGCIVADYESEIAPGRTGTVVGTFDTSGMQGLNLKYLTVFTSDPATPEQVLTMKVTVQHVLEVSPGSLAFALEAGKGAEAVVTVRSLEPGPFKILRVESSAPLVKAELMPDEPVSAAEGEASPAEHKVRVSVPPDAATRELAARVIIHTSSARRPQATIYVYAHPMGWVVALPAQIYFDETSVHIEKPLNRPITLMKREGTFQVLGAETGDPALRAEVTPNVGGRYCEVLVSYAGGWKPGIIKGRIVIRTSDPLRPRVEIPYRAEVIRSTGAGG